MGVAVDVAEASLGIVTDDVRTARRGSAGGRRRGEKRCDELHCAVAVASERIYQNSLPAEVTEIAKRGRFQSPNASSPSGTRRQTWGGNPEFFSALLGSVAATWN